MAEDVVGATHPPEDDRVRRDLLAAVAAEVNKRSEDTTARLIPEAAEYLHHVATEELTARTAADLAEVIVSHAELAQSQQRPAIRVAAGGTGHQQAVSVDVVSNDGPFRVDTISLTLTRLGWEILDLFHPQFTVTRAGRGSPPALVRTDPTHPVAGVAESWVHCLALPPAGHEHAADELVAALTTALADLDLAVADFESMRTVVRALADNVAHQPAPPGEDRVEVAHLLRWLTEGNFVVLGTSRNQLQGDSFVPEEGSGLGLLRHPDSELASFQAAPADPDSAQLLVITKDSARSTLRRAGHYDYFSVRSFDESGRCVLEHRIIGLLASTAYIEQVSRIPLLRAKAAQVLDEAGYPPDSYGAKAVIATIATYPRDELFQAHVDQLTPVIVRLAGLRERREVVTFVRWGTRRRFFYVLVSLPRDRYTTESRKAMEAVIRQRVPVETIDFRTTFSESVLCRVFFTVKVDEQQQRDDIDPAQLQAEIKQAVRTWEDEFAELSRDFIHDEVIFSGGYKEDCTPEQGLLDLRQLVHLQGPDDMQLAMFPAAPGDIAPWRVKVMMRNSMPLSQVMPQFSSLGLQVVDERPYDLLLGGEQVMVYDFGVAEGPVAWTEADTERILAAFEAVHRGLVDADALNELISRAGLSWQQVNLLRALSRYLLQAQGTYSQTYIASTLLALPDLARLLVQMIDTKFDPDLGLSVEDRTQAVDLVRADLVAALDEVSLLDHDRIIRWLMAVVEASVRTNHYQADTQALALKLLPTALDFLPEPRPAFEIFVHSPRVEGVHLRFGSVARGGLRWSDRAEDFRTEVLGLVKAQLVKNTVIVPVGAKGGFLPRRLPDPSQDRAAWLAEGQACYRIFIGSLLDLTDNRVDGRIVAPLRTVCHDPDDSYLVVAADKGTATFSDLANQISTDRGFWLGDAFASGGSHGYDHKAMGITARGAWESVKRHFAEQGIDCQTTDFTCVGIGDMSGDVFGNGMLCSEHIRLVAAFNHQHIFTDPDPDAATSHAERRRLFDLPRSSWTDYDSTLISSGGGIYERSAKSIPISEELRHALGLKASVTTLTGSELVKAILSAPVDLLWNGGIGTYVKASWQTHAEVGDRINDAVRIDASQLRCTSIGEGGNLGLTQPARVEFARAGGRVDADFIDNSAGVDTSDHEVNIKILLGSAISAGRLDESGRNRLLPEMTDEIASLVLRHNVDQNVALANAVSRAAAMAGVHEAWMQRLETSSQFDRVVEDMPDSTEMARRIEAGEGLCNPELATLMAWTKIWLADAVIDSSLPDDPYLADLLVTYFPERLRTEFADEMAAHPLRREIITTVAVNRFVNSQGISSAHRLTDEFGCGVDEVIRAQVTARAIHDADGTEAAIIASGTPPQMQVELRLALRRLIDRATRWILQNLGHDYDIATTIASYRSGVATVVDSLGQVLPAAKRRRLDEAAERYQQAGLDETTAHWAASAPLAHVAMGLVRLAETSGQDLLRSARTLMELQAKLELDTVLDRIEALPRKDRWQAQARAALRSDLLGLTSVLAGVVLSHPLPSEDDPVAQWITRMPRLRERVHTLGEITSSHEGLAPLQVALRTVRSIVDDAQALPTPTSADTTPAATTAAKKRKR